MTAEEFITHSESETSALGEQLAAALVRGDVVLLSGELGAGKTAFVRGLARGLGAVPDDVSSPTFTIVQEYAGGRTPLQHVDLYRLTPVEVDDLGLDELAAGDAIVAVEWPERWRSPPPDAIEVSLEHRTETTRHVRIRSADRVRSQNR